MKDSKKNLRRYNGLEAITLIGIVLGGRCQGVIYPRGQLSYEDIGRVQLSRVNFPKWERYGGNYLWVIV